MWKWTREHLGKTTWLVLWALLAALFSPLAIEIRDAIDRTVVSKLRSSSLFLAVLGLAILCCVLLALVYDSRSQYRQIRRYEPDPEFPDLLRHRRRHMERVCPRCLLDGRVSPIFIRDTPKIACFKKGCDFSTRHPNYKLPDIHEPIRYAGQEPDPRDTSH